MTKPNSEAHHQAVDDLDPLAHVNAAYAVVNGDSCAGQTGNETVAFAGRDAEPRGGHAVYYNREQGGA